MVSAPPGSGSNRTDDTIPDVSPHEPKPASATGLTVQDLAFVKELTNLGLMRDMDHESFAVIGSYVGSEAITSRRLDLFEAYYRGAVDEATGHARRLQDRVLLYCGDEGDSAAEVVRRLALLTPILGPIALERIGLEEDGPLVLRAGDTFAPVLDDYEDQLDTDEIDLRELGPETTSVRGLVGALNVLLARCNSRERLVQLRGDASREAYIAVSRATARRLFDLDFVEDTVWGDVEDYAAW